MKRLLIVQSGTITVVKVSLFLATVKVKIEISVTVVGLVLFLCYLYGKYYSVFLKLLVWLRKEITTSIGN